MLSGAYSVLWGAPCLVAAVDRYARADASRDPVHVGDEVRAAIDLGLIERACFVDVSGLRAPGKVPGDSRKLGLGSSAAIVVATLAAMRLDAARASTEVAPAPERGSAAVDPQAIFAGALRAHRAAQPTGSGVDVAASAFGGVLVASLGPDGSLEVRPHVMPAKLHVRVFSSPTAASTGGMIARVKAFEAADRAGFEAVIGRARDCARRVVVAMSPAAALEAMRDQDTALRDLARASGAPIFTPDFDELARVAANEGAFFGPSGAGGGDVGIYLGVVPPSKAFATALDAVGVDHLPIRVGAEGVRVVRSAVP